MEPRRPRPPITIPATPAVRPPQSESNDPPSSDRHRDSTRPLKWELEKALNVVRENIEDYESLREAFNEVSDNLKQERDRADKLEEQLREWRRASRSEDDRLVTEIDATKADLKALAKQVEAITRPQTAATAATETAIVINAARNKELLKQIAYFVGLVLLALAQLLGWRLPGRGEPTQSVPIPAVPQAQPGVQH